MKTILSIFFLFLYASIFAQSNTHHLFRYNSGKTSNQNEKFHSLVESGIILNIDKEVYKSLFDQKNYQINLTIPISNHQSVTATLEKFDVLSIDAKFVDRSANGEKQFDFRNAVLSYKGSIAGMDNSLVSISLYDGKVMGLMISSKETFVIGALKDERNIDTEDYILYQESKIKFNRDFKCGSEAFAVPEEIIRKIQEINAHSFDAGLTDLLNAKIAIDVDHYTYGVYGNSVPNASAYALALMSATSAVYVKDMNIKLTVGYLRVWSTPDPYTSSDGFVLLTQFQNEWITNQGSVDRVVAHLVSRRSLNIAGIAYLNVLCNTSSGYGLSATLNGSINQLPSYSYDVVLIGHELGHNFGSPHTHNCSWVGGPIDTCETIEGGCYSGPTRPTVGTIMSYCDITGGTVIMDFGEQPEALIRNRAESAFCIPLNNRPVFLAYPNGGETFKTSSSARIYWGASTTGTVNLEYSSNNGTSWNTIQGNVPVQQREYNWTVPYISNTSQAKVRIINSNNPSEGDTSDATFSIILNYNLFSNLSPPSFTRIQTLPTNTSTNQFIWSSTGSHPSFRYKFKIRKIGAGGVDYIFNSDNNGADTVISLRNSFSDSLAQVLGTSGDSVRCTWRSWAYNGLDSSGASNTLIVTFVRTTVGINQISSVIPERFNLENNYPNPFNPSTVIKFEVSNYQQIKISVYDLLGKELENLVNEKLEPGVYTATFDGSKYSSGVYYYRMETKDYVQTKKMLLVK